MTLVLCIRLLLGRPRRPTMTSRIFACCLSDNRFNQRCTNARPKISEGMLRSSSIATRLVLSPSTTSVVCTLTQLEEENSSLRATRV